MNRNLHRCYVPVTTRTGLQIGVAYIPKPPAMSADQERMQKAFLMRPPPSFWQRLILSLKEVLNG